MLSGKRTFPVAYTGRAVMPRGQPCRCEFNTSCLPPMHFQFPECVVLHGGCCAAVDTPLSKEAMERGDASCLLCFRAELQRARSEASEVSWGRGIIIKNKENTENVARYQGKKTKPNNPSLSWFLLIIPPKILPGEKFEYRKNNNIDENLNEWL